MLQIYEDIALQRKERFDALERWADEVRRMSETHQNRFVRILRNLKTRDDFLELLAQAVDKGGLKISRADLRIFRENLAWKEMACLLYLLYSAQD